MNIKERHFARRQARNDGLVLQRGFWCHARFVDKDMGLVSEVYDNDTYGIRQLNIRPTLILDIGSHIGSFACLCHSCFPDAEIICIEACPEHIEPLQRNAGRFARIVHAACTYLPGPICLLNSITSHDPVPGSSQVVPSDDVPEHAGYWVDKRFLKTVTLEDLLDGRDAELVKLDCEYSEFSILENTQSLPRIRHIVGEFHDAERWQQLRRDRLAGWSYEERPPIFHCWK